VAGGMGIYQAHFGADPMSCIRQARFSGATTKCGAGGAGLMSRLESIVWRVRDLDASQYFGRTRIHAGRQVRHELPLGRRSRPGNFSSAA